MTSASTKTRRRGESARRTRDARSARDTGTNTRTSASERVGADDGAGAREPFVCKIEGPGLHVDFRVDDGRSIRDLAQAISGAVSDGVRIAMGGPCPTAGRAEDLRDLEPGLPIDGLPRDGLPRDGLPRDGLPIDRMASVFDRTRSFASPELTRAVLGILARDPAPDDADVERALTALSQERDRRQERRS